MSWTIGMPSLKLNNVGNKSKKCGSFSAVTAEALEERQGLDEDIDHSKTAENIYTGFRSSAELQAYSAKHIAELSERQQAAGGRKVRADAVVMCATIIKPPAAMMAELSRDEQIQFLRDAERKLDEIIGAENSKSSVIHFDEQGAHLHKFWEPMTEDGRLCAKEVHSLKFFGRLNREMPEHLRSCGWDIEDCHAYDQAEEQLKSEEQKAEERRSRGMTSVSFKAQAEKRKNDLQGEIDRLENALNDVREPVLRLYEVEAIKRRAEVKKAFWGGSESVVMPRDDYDKLIAQAEHGCAADVEVNNITADKEYAERDRDYYKRRCGQLDADNRKLSREVKRLSFFETFVNRFSDLREKFEHWLEETLKKSRSNDLTR